MEEIVHSVALCGDLECLEYILLMQVLGEERAAPQIRSVKFPRFNLHNFSREDCVNNFRFEKDDLKVMMDALGIPTTIIIEDRSIQGNCQLCLFEVKFPLNNSIITVSHMANFALSARAHASHLVIRSQNTRCSSSTLNTDEIHKASHLSSPV